MQIWNSEQTVNPMTEIPEMLILTTTNNSPSKENRSVLNIIAGVNGQKAEQAAREQY